MIAPTVDVIRAWTDEDYRRSLSPGDLTLLPTHPAGDIALLDADIQAIYGTDPEMDEGGHSGVTYCVSTGSCCDTESTGTLGPCCSWF